MTRRPWVRVVMTLVTVFCCWLAYQPPKTGGKPSFSLAMPTGAQAHATRRHSQGFQPIIPKRLASPAHAPLPGDRQWRVLATVHGEPAMLSTFLRPDSTHTSYVAGIVSMDQRLVRFRLHPGAEDPGPGNWGSPTWIPPGERTGRERPDSRHREPERGSQLGRDAPPARGPAAWPAG